MPGALHSPANSTQNSWSVASMPVRSFESNSEGGVGHQDSNVRHRVGEEGRAAGKWRLAGCSVQEGYGFHWLEPRRPHDFSSTLAAIARKFSIIPPQLWLFFFFFNLLFPSEVSGNWPIEICNFISTNPGGLKKLSRLMGNLQKSDKLDISDTYDSGWKEVNQ